MTIPRFRKSFSIFCISLVIVAQFAFVTNIFTPKKAEAFWGIGDFNFSTIVVNWAEIAQEVAEGALMRVAQNYANKYLTRFVNKLVDKYKINNYLFYDKYLSNYYLSNLILDKVQDPDLRRAYELMLQATVTGDVGGYTGFVCQGGSGSTQAACEAAGGRWLNSADPRKALIPKLKVAVNQYYLNKGGIDPNKVYNPGVNVSDTEYFATVRSYFSNPVSFTEQNLRAGFGEFQTAATTASQLEIAVGSGNKAGRAIVGSCDTSSIISGGGLPTDDVEGDAASGITDLSGLGTNVDGSALAAGGGVEAKDPVACSAVGGVWKKGALDTARDLITNPTAMVSQFMESALNTIFTSNYNPHDIWTAIGSALGDFAFKKLDLQNTNGTFDDGSGYQASDAVTKYNEIDLDSDGFPDGLDVNKDGRLATKDVDECYHGGIAPNCKQSSQVSTSPYFAPLCEALDQAIKTLSDFVKYMDDHSDQIEANGVDFVNPSDANIWARRTGQVDNDMSNLMGAVQSLHSPKLDTVEITLGRFDKYIGEESQSLIKDGDLDLAVIGTGGGELPKLKEASNGMLTYLKNVKATLDKCNAPNLDAAGSVVPPVIPIPGAGSSCLDAPNFLACSKPDHTDLVIRVKNFLVAQGVSLVGPCGAFEITKRVAWALRDEGAGVLTTFHSGQCNGLAHDIVAYPDNSAADILGDAGGANTPMWSPGPPNPEPGVNYQPPSDPGDPPGSY